MSCGAAFSKLSALGYALVNRGPLARIIHRFGGVGQASRYRGGPAVAGVPSRPERRVLNKRAGLLAGQDRSRDQERERTPVIAGRDERPRQTTSQASHCERSGRSEVGILDLESVLNDLASDVAGAWTKAG